MSELEKKMKDWRNGEQNYQTMREASIRKLPFNDMICFNSDTNSLRNYERHKQNWIRGVKYVCGKMGKDYKDSIIFKCDVHRKKIELAQALQISEEKNSRRANDQWYLNLRDTKMQHTKKQFQKKPLR